MSLLLLFQAEVIAKETERSDETWAEVADGGESWTIIDEPDDT